MLDPEWKAPGRYEPVSLRCRSDVVKRDMASLGGRRGKMSRSVGVWDRHSNMSEVCGRMWLTYGWTIHSFSGGRCLSCRFCNMILERSGDLLISLTPFIFGGTYPSTRRHKGIQEDPFKSVSFPLPFPS
jgi:hypothetical protein